MKSARAFVLLAKNIFIIIEAACQYYVNKQIDVGKAIFFLLLKHIWKKYVTLLQWMNELMKLENICNWRGVNGCIFKEDSLWLTQNWYHLSSQSHNAEPKGVYCIAHGTVLVQICITTNISKLSLHIWWGFDESFSGPTISPYYLIKQQAQRISIKLGATGVGTTATSSKEQNFSYKVCLWTCYRFALVAQ